MQIVINNIKMPIKHTESDVIMAAREIVRSNCVCAKNFSIYKQSIDARRKSNIHYVYTVVAETDNAGGFPELKQGGDFDVPQINLKERPVIVGMGPCGLFAAYVLALSGNPPIVLERGGDVDERIEKIDAFWQKGKLDVNTNVQFGEGGAGTFSDGKLTTRIGDARQRFVLKSFADFGAPSDILYKAKPHIGTDMLRTVIKNMRNKLIELGAEIRFNTCVTDIKINGGKVCEIELNGTESLKTGCLIMAIGHSSRDTYSVMEQAGVMIEPKPFAIGVRIEHSQKFIDTLQYGNVKGLPPADYRVVYNGKDRSCYSFCMCPGGQVVNASSEEGMLCVNGMSYHSRDGKNANSALVVTVNPDDFENGLLGGIEFQRKYERLAFKAGDYGKAPVQRAEDFIKDVKTDSLSGVIPTITGYKFAELKNCLPDFVTATLKEGLLDFERRMRGFSSGGAILTGVETRTSAPVRILRNENLESVNIKGLYPAGEGAGYAGGIVSAAVDGIRVALSLITKNVSED